MIDEAEEHLAELSERMKGHEHLEHLEERKADLKEAEELVWLIYSEPQSMSPSRVGPNLDNPTCLCPAAATCWHGKECHSRRTTGNYADDMPICYRKQEEDKE
jgi:hypothetical protein